MASLSLSDRLLMLTEVVSEPTLMPAGVGLARVYMSQNKVREAHDLLRKFLPANPNSVQIHVMLGDIYRATGQLRAAEVSYGRALSLAPAFDLVDIAREIEHADQMINGRVGGQLEVIAEQVRSLQMSPLPPES